MRPFLAALAVALVLPAAALAAAFDVGPAVGQKVPALQASTTDGAATSVRQLSGSKGLVLVFFRSAKWCPYCQKQLIQLRAAQGPLEQRGYRLAALSYDPTDVLIRFAAQRGVAYPLLSDNGSKTIDAFKLRDVRYKPESFAWGVPYASIFLLSPSGVVQAKLAEEDYKVRPTNEAVMAAVDALASRR